MTTSILQLAQRVENAQKEKNELIEAVLELEGAEAEYDQALAALKAAVNAEGDVAEEAETGAGDAEADDRRAKEIEAEAQQIYSRNIRELNGQVDPVDGQEFGVPDFRTPEEQAYRDAFTSNGTAGDPDQGKPRTVSANTAEVADPLDETGAV